VRSYTTHWTTQGFAVRIKGPKGLHWNWTFFGQEQGPESIQQSVAGGIIAQQCP